MGVPVHEVAAIGRQLRAARHARDLTLGDLAARTGLSIRFLSELERGKRGASIGRVVHVAETLGVTLSLEIEDEARVDLTRFPVLKSLAWQRHGQRYIGEREALALYESNWRFVDRDDMPPREEALLSDLIRRHAHGVLNV